jgi:hypothetical protein
MEKEARVLAWGENLQFWRILLSFKLFFLFIVNTINLTATGGAIATSLSNHVSRWDIGTLMRSGRKNEKDKERKKDRDKQL